MGLNIECTNSKGLSSINTFIDSQRIRHMMMLIQLTRLQFNEDTCLKAVTNFLNFAMIDDEL